MTVSMERADPAKSLESAIERQESTLDRQLEWIRAVDSKTPIVMGFATTMIAATVALAPAPKDFTWCVFAKVATGIIPFGISLLFCAWATFPRTEGPPGSMIFFGGISKITRGEYIAAIARRTEAEHLEDLSSQCHQNAKIATVKYKSVRCAMWFLFGGIPLWLIAIYLLIWVK